MLIKIGKAWVDPSHVSAVHTYDNHSTVVLKTGIQFSPYADADEIAKLINESFQTQSYGASDETVG